MSGNITREENMSTVKKKVIPFVKKDRTTDIKAISALAKTARDDALKIGLKFEAYLLDMAFIALSEQSQK